MKIICIGRNYAEHAKEMKSEVPTEPVFFMKPDTALLKDNEPFYFPDFTKDLHHEIEVTLQPAIYKHNAKQRVYLGKKRNRLMALLPLENL